MDTYPAIVTTGEGPATLTELTDADLPAGDVIVDVACSSLNYKDGLAVTGKGRIARRLPMVCGIDLAGTVASSDSADWAVGDEVVVTGWGLSETHPGGYTGRQALRSSWLVARPDALDLRRCMAIGTAGLTAMLCVLALEDHGALSAGPPSAGPPSAASSGGAPVGHDEGGGAEGGGAEGGGAEGGDDDGEVLVTGAAGGVGSVAVAILAQLGHRVAASTGRPEAADYLRSLGASTIVDRAELATAGKPLAAERWAAVIDTVGSTTLATALSQTRYRGAVAACGLAGGNDLPATVMPFILRNVALLGVDSVLCPLDRRRQAWERLATDLPPERLDAMTTVEPLEKVPELAGDILAGRTRGRVVIDVAGRR